MANLKKYLSQLVDPNLKRLAAYLPPYRWKILSATFFMIGAGVASSLIATLLGKLTDVGFYNQQPWIIIGAPVGLIFISILHGGSMFMSNYLLGKVSQAVLKTIRQQIFHRILHWPSNAYQTYSTGLVSSKFVFEANFGLSNGTKSLVILVRDTCQVICLTVVLFWHNFILSLISLVIAPLVIILLKYISNKMKSIMASSQMSVADLLVRVKEAYEAHQLIKISNTYSQEIKRFSKLNAAIRLLMLRMAKVSSLGTPVTQFICMLGVAIVLTVAMFQTQLGFFTLGQFVTFLAALLLIMPPLRHLAGLNASFVMIKVAAESIFQMMDQPLEKDNGTVQIQGCNEGINFEHVSLRYPNADHDAVHDFNLKVKSGSIIALVGLSGSGKSSLVNMIPRFWNPTSGHIFFDGIDTQNISLQSLRKQIAIVSQDIVLFEGTIKENIIYGSPEATEYDLWNAINASALKDFIDSLPNGVDTPIGEAGDKLSGGQKQRISIARAILKKAPILILDEATSALDSVSETLIKESLTKLMRGKTTFIVAHRLSTIDNADIIVAMDHGEIKETGTKQQLLQNKNGLFSKLTQLQELK